MKTSNFVLEHFAIYSYQTLNEIKGSLGITNLEPDNVNTKQKLSTLQIEYLLFGKVDFISNDIDLIIMELPSGKEIFNWKFSNSKSSTALKDIVKLFSDGIKPVYKKVGYFTVQLSDKDAENVEVRIDGNKVKNIKKIEVTTGEHKLEIIKKGYKKIEEKISITTSNVSKPYSLEKMMGKIKVSSDTKNASNILYEGTQRVDSWFGDQLKSFPAGEYQLKSEILGHEPQTKTIKIEPDQTTYVDIKFNKSDKVENLSINLEEPVPGTNRTWNWITTGLTVVTGSAAGYYLTQSVSNFANYKSATSQASALEFRKKTEDSTEMFNIFISIGSAALISTMLLWIFN